MADWLRNYIKSFRDWLTRVWWIFGNKFSGVKSIEPPPEPCVWLNVTVSPVDIQEKIENECETLTIKFQLPEDNNSVGSKKIICEIPNIENFAAVTHLNLSKCFLKELPDSLNVFNNLLVFDVSENRLTKVPSCLEKNMLLLKKIDLSFNKIETFDFVPACVMSLKELNISHTDIQEFPKWLNNAINLVKIDIASNILSKETDPFENVLTGVKSLNLSSCNFPSFILLEKFPNLEYLDFGGRHRLLDFGLDRWHFCIETNKRHLCLDVDYNGRFLCNPEIYPSYCIHIDRGEVLKNNRKLKTLRINYSWLRFIDHISLSDTLTLVDLQNNNLRYLPDAFTLLKNLKECILSNNIFKTLPDNFSQLQSLEKLHLNYNYFRYFPECLSEMPSLIYLDVYENFLNNIPACYKNFLYFDISKNDLDEPDCEIYLKIRDALRKQYDGYQLRENARVPASEIESHFGNNRPIVRQVRAEYRDDNVFRPGKRSIYKYTYNYNDDDDESVGHSDNSSDDEDDPGYDEDDPDYDEDDPGYYEDDPGYDEDDPGYDNDNWVYIN